jgi:hypothetical protein
LRWAYWTQLPAAQALAHVKDKVFPFIKALGGKGGSFAAQMTNAEFKINKPNLRVEACKVIDAVRISSQNQDVQGDLYEYLLSKLNTAGHNGQFRTPRRIIRLLENGGCAPFTAKPFARPSIFSRRCCTARSRRACDAASAIPKRAWSMREVGTPSASASQRLGPAHLAAVVGQQERPAAQVIDRDGERHRPRFVGESLLNEVGYPAVGLQTGFGGMGWGAHGVPLAEIGVGWRAAVPLRGEGSPCKRRSHCRRGQAF